MGPIRDRKDGTYELRVRSSGTGNGTVVVTVEGSFLADQPSVSYTAP